MGSRVFLNYRRGDSSGHTGRLYDALTARFGADQVFIDVDNIAFGQDFVARIGEVLSMVDVTLVVIGREWLDASTSDGRRRLDDPGDFVRIEIETALRRGILVVPVLVEGAEMPSSAALPAPLQPLARRNACSLDDRDWKRGVARLVNALDGVVETGHFPAIPEPDASEPGPAHASGSEPRRGRLAALIARVRLHPRAGIAVIGSIAILLAAAALGFLRSGSGGSEDGGIPAAGAQAGSLVNRIQSSVHAATGQPFQIENGCSRWGLKNQPPDWVTNAVRLTFPSRTCRITYPANRYNKGNIFQVVVARDGHLQAAWDDLVNGGPFDRQPGPDGIYRSPEQCKGAKHYAPSVWMTWWIKGCATTPSTDANWQTVDAAVQEAVDGTG